MPNSLVTFDRFWSSAGTAIDQPLITLNFLQANAALSGVTLNQTTCTLAVPPP
jgi:hypothetical protein